VPSFRLKLKSEGVRALLHSPSVVADLQERAERVLDDAGGEEEGFAIIEADDEKRARRVVVTATPEAMTLEAEDRVLTAAIDAARG